MFTCIIMYQIVNCYIIQYFLHLFVCLFWGFFLAKKIVALRCLLVRIVLEKTGGGTYVLTDLDLKDNGTGLGNLFYHKRYVDTRLGNKSFKFQGFPGSIAKTYNCPVYMILFYCRLLQLLSLSCLYGGFIASLPAEFDVVQRYLLP